MSCYSYWIFKDLNLYYSHFRGKTNIDDIYDFVNNLSKHKDYDSNISGIVDFQDTTLQFKMNDGKKYVDFVSKNSTIIGDRRVAFLTTTPQQTTHSFEYQFLAKHLPMKVEVFTTLEACLRWIGVSLENIDRISSSFT